MTDLDKPIKRITHVQTREAGHWRNIVVVLQPNGTIGFRAKGCKSIYYMPIDKLYSMAAKAHAVSVIAAKKKEREARRKARRAGKA